MSLDGFDGVLAARGDEAAAARQQGTHGELVRTDQSHEESGDETQADKDIFQQAGDGLKGIADVYGKGGELDKIFKEMHEQDDPPTKAESGDDTNADPPDPDE